MTTYIGLYIYSNSLFPFSPFRLKLPLSFLVQMLHVQQIIKLEIPKECKNPRSSINNISSSSKALYLPPFPPIKSEKRKERSILYILEKSRVKD